LKHIYDIVFTLNVQRRFLTTVIWFIMEGFLKIL